MSYKLQILVPQHQEDDAIVKNLLNSIAIQQSIDFKDISVLICNDGSDILLSDRLINAYPFRIEYFMEPHRGVSATRNFLLDHADSDYVMFCDADDTFLSTLGLWMIFQKIRKGFDVLFSLFLEEIIDPETNEFAYNIRELDGIFVHGKVFRRKYLNEQKIRFDESLYINEDSYFVALCQSISQDQVYISDPFYLWKYRKNSISHSDPKYQFTAYKHMLDSNDALIKELMARNLSDKAELYVVQMMIDAFFTMTEPEWESPENDIYVKPVLCRFSEWLREHKAVWDSVRIQDKTSILKQLIEHISVSEAHNAVSSIEKWLRKFQ